MPPGIGSVATPAGPIERPAEDRATRIRTAATQFEALLIQQLVQVMRSTVGEGGMFGSGAGSAMYSHLFDQGFSDALSESGGLGMRAMIERSMLGPSAYGAQAPTGPRVPFTPRVVSAPLEVRPASGAPIEGMTGRLQSAARQMLGPTGLAPQWGHDGRLTETDLASDFTTEGPSGTAAFNVDDAAGFQDRYKCNLFAFELTRRAGFVTPLIGRTRGWGYLGPDGATADAAAGRMRSNWGQVATGESAESLDAGIVRGERAFLLTATGANDRAGHMGVIERVHEIDYDDAGEVRRIVFDGWEGRTYGATHLERREWVREGSRASTGARGGFERIEIVELRRPEAGERPERPLHAHANPSVHDLRRLEENPSSPAGDRPMMGSEAP
ncbi:MAG: rod-binding protein [Myxococcales bacterium]|nr:rod-binding protein [Myxococcales bacterium]